MTSPLPEHMRLALDAIGVRAAARAVIPPPREATPVDPWWTRGEECPH